MKIISMNIRGIWGYANKKYLEELIKKEQAEVVCLQETKCKEMEKESIFKMWGSNEIDWVERGAVNNAGGMITMWRRRCLQVTNAFAEENFCIIQGEWSVGEAT